MKRFAVALLLAVPLAARAQEAAPLLQEDPRAARFHEVERGFFVGLDAGVLGLLKTPTQDATRFPSAGSGGGFASGFLMGLDVGYEVTSRLALSLFGLGAENRASASYGGFDLLAAGGDVRVALFAARDSQGVERLYGYLHARAGYVWSHPQGLFDATDLLLGGGAGLEYRTRLRHFSVGLAVDGLYLKNVKVAGFSLAPTLRYTF